IEALIVIGIGVTVIACLGTLAERLVRCAVWQRTLWQTAILATIGLMGVQVTGLRAGVFLTWNHRADPHDWVSESSTAVTEPGAEQPTDWLMYETPLPDEAGFEKPATEEGRKPVGFDSNADTNWSERIAAYLPMALLLGTAACLLRIVWGRLVLFALTRRCLRAEASLDEQLRSVAHTLGIRRRVWLWVARAVRGPLAFGTLRPTIVVPETFAAAFDRSRRQVILAHELAHLAAFDPFWLGLANVTCAVLWWHPLAWWMRRRLRSVSEAAADEASLLVPDGPELLAGCLVEMGRRLVQPARVPGLSVEGSGFRSELGRRVERLLSLESQTWRAPRRLPLMFVKSILPPVLVLAALSCTAWAEPGLSLVQPAEGDATMNVWKSSWRGSLAATALCALWNPVATADENPAAESATVRAKGDVRVIAVDVPIQITAEEVETFRFPEGQRPNYIKFFQPNGVAVAQTTEEQTARNREQLDRARLGTDDEARKNRRERLERQYRLAEKARDLGQKLDELGEGREEERIELARNLLQVENEMRELFAPTAHPRASSLDGPAVVAAPGVPVVTPPGLVTRVRVLPPGMTDPNEARLRELKGAVAELEATVARDHATATQSNRMFMRSAAQWQRSGVIKAVGSDDGAPALSIDMQDGTVLGLQKLGEGVHLTLRGKEARLDELKPEMPVALTWTPQERGWKLHTIDAEPQRRHAEVQLTPVPGPRIMYEVAPNAGRTAPRKPVTAPPVRSPGERNPQELEGQVERMRGQMEELQKQISELRDLLKPKAEGNSNRS
ncbi:MAG TPA: M56 family metallopeptidase, partial [Planctomycetaceae bacterium]|nr:M56 family metallopeptidase [Planctomycetaceae bacterium]